MRLHRWFEIYHRLIHEQKIKGFLFISTRTNIEELHAFWTLVCLNHLLYTKQWYGASMLPALLTGPFHPRHHTQPAKSSPHSHRAATAGPCWLVENINTTIEGHTYFVDYRVHRPAPF